MIDAKTAAKELVEEHRKLNVETDVCFGDCESQPYSVCTHTGHGCGLWLVHAKKSALISVEIIISIFKKKDGPAGSTYINDGKFYWMQVKKAIESM